MKIRNNETGATTELTIIAQDGENIASDLLGRYYVYGLDDNGVYNVSAWEYDRLQKLAAAAAQIMAEQDALTAAELDIYNKYWFDHAPDDADGWETVHNNAMQAADDAQYYYVYGSKWVAGSGISYTEDLERVRKTDTSPADLAREIGATMVDNGIVIDNGDDYIITVRNADGAELAKYWVVADRPTDVAK